MADGVDAAVDLVKVAAAKPAIDRIRRETAFDELSPRDDPVLMLCQCRHIGPTAVKPILTANSAVKIGFTLHALTVAARERARGAGVVPIR